MWGVVWAEPGLWDPGWGVWLQQAGRPGSARRESASTKGDSAGGRMRTRLLDRNSHRLDILPRISVTTGGWRSVVPPRGQLTAEGLGGLNLCWRQLASLG